MHLFEECAKSGLLNLFSGLHRLRIPGLKETMYGYGMIHARTLQNYRDATRNEMNDCVTV